MGGRQRARWLMATAVGVVALQLGSAATAGAADRAAGVAPGVAPDLAAGVAVRLAPATPGRTLWQRTFEAEIVVHARIVHPQWEISIGEPPTPYPVVEAKVLEVLKGDVAPGRLTFARDGHERPPYALGQETLLFLRPIATSASLAGTTVAAAVSWTSLPASVANVQLTSANRSAYLTATRSYAAIVAMPQSAKRGARLRALTMELVISPEPALARSALRDLALAGNAPLLTRAEAGHIGRLVFNPTVPIATRLALLHELERRGLVFGPTAWARLLRETQGPELAAVMRAVRGHQSTAVNLELEKMLKGSNRALALAAAHALASVGNDNAVRPFLRRLDTRDPALRRAIVQGLGRIHTQRARQALDLVAREHPDPATRQAALTEVLVLARRHGTTLAPMIAPRDARRSAAGSPPLSTARALRTTR